MHFALPPRKTSRPPPYVASRPLPSSYRRRGRLKVLLWSLGGILFLIIILSQFRRGRSRPRQIEIPPNTPPVVLVTTFESATPNSYRELIEQNRRQYALKHNYAVFIANSADYDLTTDIKDTKNTSSPEDTKSLPTPETWAKIPAMRHAMTNFPQSTYFFFLDQRSLIANPTLSIEHHILEPSRLETIMILNQPVVPPNSVIKTINERRGAQVDLVMTQDHEGLRPESFIVRRGEWAKFFLDSWFDPLYRSYNFQRADGHALEHLVQWHGMVLARLALIPQKIMNSYYIGLPEEAFLDGDFVANLHRCDNSTTRSCEKEAKIVSEIFKAQLVSKKGNSKQV